MVPVAIDLTLRVFMLNDRLGLRIPFAGPMTFTGVIFRRSRAVHTLPAFGRGWMLLHHQGQEREG